MSSPALNNEKQVLPKWVTCDMFKWVDGITSIRNIRDVKKEQASNIISLNTKEVKEKNKPTTEEIRQIDFLMKEYVYEIDDAIKKWIKIINIIKYKSFYELHKELSEKYPNNLKREFEDISMKYRIKYLEEKIFHNIENDIKGYNKNLENRIKELREILPGYDFSEFMKGLDDTEIDKLKKIFDNLKIEYKQVVYLEEKILNNIKNRNESHNEELEKYVYELIHIDHGIHLQNLLTSLTVQEKNYIKSYL